MRILVVSDTENEFIWDHFDETRFKDIELIISCGDLKSQYLSFLTTMIKAPLFYVHGNHDTGYAEEPPGGCDTIEDNLVNYKGLRIVGLGGCIKYNDHPYYSVPPYQYTEKQMAKRIRKLKLKLHFSKGLDILVTHATAHGIGDAADCCHTGFNCFIPFIEKYNPRYMIHGHMHMHYGRGPRTVTYNQTSIIDAYGYYILDI